MLVSLLAGLASTVFILRLLPQPFRLARSGVDDGVSPLAALNAVVAAAAWTAYGLSAGLWAVWVVSLVALVPGVWTVALLRSTTRRSDVAWAGLWVLVIAASVLVGAEGFVLACTVGVTSAPQVWKVLTDRELSGVSAAAWWLACLDAVVWGAYGLAVGDGPLIGYAVVLGASAVVVLARLTMLGGAAPVPASASPAAAIDAP